MGIKDLKNMNISELPKVPVDAVISEKLLVCQGRTALGDAWDRIHPSAAYKVVGLLKKLLTPQMLRKGSVIREEIPWQPSEKQENSEVMGIVKFQLNHMLAAAIMGDIKTLLSDHEKGMRMFCKEPEYDYLHISVLDMMQDVSNRYRTLIGCYIDDGTGVYMRAAEVIRQCRMWGMLLWPVWEEETKVHRTLWKILKEEYEEADSSWRNKMWKVILDSIDSLYFQEYQKKAMEICMKVFAGIHIPIKESMFREVGKLPLVDSWARAVVFMKYEVFPKLCAGKETGISWKDEMIMAASVYMLQWDLLNDLIYICYDNGMKSYDHAYVEEKSVLENRMWPNDAVGREIEKMERREYQSGRYKSRRSRYFGEHLQILDELVKKTDKEEVWKRYLFFLNSLWKWGAGSTIQEDYEAELKNRILQMNQSEPWVKEEYLSFEKETMKQTGINVRLFPQKHLHQLQFYKEKIRPAGKLTFDMADMENFKSICYVKDQTDSAQDCECMLAAELLDENIFFDEDEVFCDDESYDEDEVFCDDESYDADEAFCEDEFYETDGCNVYYKGEIEERNNSVKEIWKIIDFHIADESCLYAYQKKILRECNEEDFLYARECGLFPTSILEKAQEYAVEAGILKVILAIAHQLEDSF